MKFPCYRILHVKADSSVIPICKITGLSNAIFLTHSLQRFLDPDDYIVLQTQLPSGCFEGHGAFSRSGSVSPAKARLIPCLQQFC